MTKKYRGKHEGRTRGPYEKKELLYEAQSGQEGDELTVELNDFLTTKGYGVGWPAVEKTWEKEFYTNVYHVAGATIVINYSTLGDKRYQEVKNRPGGGQSQHELGIFLTSNDSLDDVLQIILDKFPMFKKS